MAVCRGNKCGGGVGHIRPRPLQAYSKYCENLKGPVIAEQTFKRQRTLRYQIRRAGCRVSDTQALVT